MWTSKVVKGKDKRAEDEISEEHLDRKLRDLMIRFQRDKKAEDEISEGHLDKGILRDKRAEDEISEEHLGRSQFQDLKLKDFEMIRTIGTGSYGRVVKCRRKDTSKYYAMKIFEIADIIQKKEVDHVKNEKSILVQVDHPFIIYLYWTYHDHSCLYMLFEYCVGDLLHYLRRRRAFRKNDAMFYAAEIVLALEYLHDLCIVHRDLKPENLLVDREGHVKMADFGFAKALQDRTWTICGTPEYMAPEVILDKGHDTAVDWWSLGILIFEMLSGYPPFKAENQIEFYEKLGAADIKWHKRMNKSEQDLIRRLLQPEPEKRLGNLKHGAEDVKNHEWFRNTVWEDVYNKRLKPPIVPIIPKERDSKYREFEENIECKHSVLSEDFLAIFKDF